MKPTKILMCALALGAMTFVTNAAPVAPVLIKLNLSGTIIVNTNSSVDNGKTSVLKPIKRSYNTKDIVKLLNASTNFNNYLDCVTDGAITNLPAGTYFAYDLYGYNIDAVLPDGSTVLMQGFDCSNPPNFFSFLSMDFGQIGANYSMNIKGAGSETDQLSEWWIEIIDYNNPTTDIRVQGQMNLTWSAGALSNNTRKLNVSANFTGSGDAEYQGFPGTGIGKAGGSGSAASVISDDWPFWIWWNINFGE
jgi:hypothetical protein